jgi:hypothetical protein
LPRSKKRNAPIAQFFHSDAGKRRLMWYEAFLLRDNMLEAMKREIPFVPLHDAMMVPTGSHRELATIMETNLAVLRVSLGVQFKRRKKGRVCQFKSTDHQEDHMTNHNHHLATEGISLQLVAPILVNSLARLRNRC